MRKPLSFLIGVALIAGCATSNVGPRKLYTKQEYNKLTFCVGMSDTAMYVATNKLRDVPEQEMAKFYAARDNSRLNLATVEKVYGATFTSAWDYTVAFFNECAQNLANVPSSRVNMAEYCMQRGLIADFAYGFKTTGAPKERAYAYFAKFPEKTTHEIIDRVYTSSMTRPETKLDAWNTCMSAISATN